MSWCIGYDNNWKRDIGYGVLAICDYPDCNREIDRGMSYVCGGEPYGGEHGCGLYFCGDHQFGPQQLCHRCRVDKPPFKAKPDCEKWTQFKLTDESWEQWRKDNSVKKSNEKY